MALHFFISQLQIQKKEGPMRLQQIVGKSTISDIVRHRIEKNDFYSTSTARQIVQREFPHHIVDSAAGKISVQVKDRTFAVAVFREVL
jgi:hypothetical protein